MNRITAIKVRPGMKPGIIEIDNTLESLQREVGGLIEIVHPWKDRVALICNEEGKLLGLEPNRSLRYEDGPKEGEIYDVIMGDFLVVGLPPREEDYGQLVSLTKEMQEKYVIKFGPAEAFIGYGSRINVVSFEGEEFRNDSDESDGSDEEEEEN